MTYHVHTAVRGGWVVRREGSSRAYRHFLTKDEAVDYVLLYSRLRWSELMIHRRDGTVAAVVTRDKPDV